MKNILLAVAVLALFGCDAETRDSTRKYILPAGLERCKIYDLSRDGTGNTMTIVVCPNSTVSTSERVGKTDQYTTTYSE